MFPVKYVFDRDQAAFLTEGLRAVGASTRFCYVETEGYRTMEEIRSSRFMSTFDLADHTTYSTEAPAHAHNCMFSEEGTWAASLEDSFGIAIVAGRPELMAEWETRLGLSWASLEDEALDRATQFFAWDFSALRSLISTQPVQRERGGCRVRQFGNVT